MIKFCENTNSNYSNNNIKLQNLDFFIQFIFDEVFEIMAMPLPPLRLNDSSMAAILKILSPHHYNFFHSSSCTYQQFRHMF
mmetsp:Transcript_29995/g.54863  ORF Transcript_29995/g.54863 Transcript_29995/m.54863 type:complete len:81 (-) Transcript_29995:266-508(-)